MLHLNGQRSVLQRRSNISNALQALLDGTAVLGIAYWLIDRHLGFVSAPYTFMVVLLLGLYFSVNAGYLEHRRELSERQRSAWFAWSVVPALIAWPADYANSGVMTFMVNHEGRVYQKDLGADTATAVEAIQLFDPDESWSLVVSNEGD